ncbi:hypothetical protein L207DRAFT_506261 [Hyaloscypha variabilis F]|uniref:Uncharacterized protein n=1 Tax=Hyaloscypha variabilis (strain UAMH 11265 / GT02V1 / F) TaxID=1149755 RepID=A0A2J6S916_HYAVF|nr:hypothetical protein L207DRAFT_506261 [Hyaloscypha variabilis F]
MCFGDRTNPEIHAGTDNLDKTHTRTSDYADQHHPNRPVKASKSAGGWFANTPAGKSNALIKAMPKEELKQNRKNGYYRGGVAYGNFYGNGFGG